MRVAVVAVSMVLSAGVTVRIIMCALAAMFVIVTGAMIVMVVLGRMSGAAVIFHSLNCPTVDRMSAGAETGA